jgi:hypothetical protein
MSPPNDTNNGVATASPNATATTTKEAATSNHMLSWGRMVEYIKYSYSTILLLFSVVVVMYAIFSQQTGATKSDWSIYLVAICFWICIVWLGIMEGTQGAIVGLQSVSPLLYQASHPRTFQNTQLIYQKQLSGAGTEEQENNNRLERFIVGRQFLVVMVVFILNTLSTATPTATLFKETNNAFLKAITTIFLYNGVAAILLTIIIGQLIAQIVSSNCMLDFLNNYLVYGTEQISLFIESSGLLHAVYAFQMLLERSTTNTASTLSFWCRVFLSIVILVFSFVVTITALVKNQTKMWDSIPIPVSILLFIILMMVVGMLEGLQIALFAVIRRTDLQTEYPMAYANSQMIFSKSENLPAFLIGRQIMVTVCMFIVARITSINVNTTTDKNIFGVSDQIQGLFNTGLLGAIITTIMASLIWRIIASSYPVAFLSNPVVYVLIRLCLFLEMSGICSSAWILAFFYKKVMNCNIDEVYISINNKEADEDEPNEKQFNNKNDLDLEETA